MAAPRHVMAALPRLLSGFPEIETWLRRHCDLFAFVTVAAGFGIWIVSARGTYLNGDEALHFQAVNLPLFSDVYRASLTSAHPPLFFLLLHSWHLLGDSEFFLRVPSAIFGAAFLWVAYRWASSLFGLSTGLLALVFLAFSPALVSLSAEIRGYALLLLLTAAALAVFEEAIRTQSPRRMAASFTLLSLAILTHYSAFFVAFAVFVYGLVRVRRAHLPARTAGTWAVFQLAVGVLSLLLVLTHVAHLRGSAMERRAMGEWLRTEYFEAATDRPLGFLLRQTVAGFGFLCGSREGGLVASVLGAAGVILLSVKRQLSALLLALPFLLGAGAGLLGVYPYGGTRHSAYLLLFASAAVAVALSALASGRLWPALLLLAVLAPVTIATAVPAAHERRIDRMTGAINQLRAAAPPGSLLFVDVQTGSLLEYYLGRNASARWKAGLQRFSESSAGGVRIIESPVWRFSANIFRGELARLVRVYQLPARQSVWLMTVGLELDPAREVSRVFPGAGLPLVRRFGEIALVEATLP